MSWRRRVAKLASFGSVFVFDVALSFFLCMGVIALANEIASRIVYGDPQAVCRALCLHRLEMWQFLALWFGAYLIYRFALIRLLSRTLGALIVSQATKEGTWRTKVIRGVAVAGVAFVVVSELLSYPLHHFMHGEPLSDRAKFYAQIDPIPANENSYFAWIGLTAPEGVDPMRYGQDFYARKLASFSLLSEEKEAPDLDLESRMNGKTLECWWEDLQPDPEKCLSEEELEKLLAEYAPYLDRFDVMTSKPIFAEMHPFINGRGSVFLDLERLKLVWIIYQMKNGHGDLAMREWIKLADFNNRAIAGRQSFVGKAIVMTSFSRVLHLLPVMADHNPELLGKYRDDIHRVLSVPAFGPGGWDFRETGKMEYMIFATALAECRENPGVSFFCLPDAAFCLPNAAANRMAEAMDSYAETSLKEPFDIKKDIEAMKDKEESFSLFTANTIPSLLFSGFLRGTELFYTRHSSVAFARLLDLYAEARARGIQPEQMEDFVREQAAEGRVNPLTGKAFDWDRKTQTLSLYDIFAEKQRFEIHYGPVNHPY